MRAAAGQARAISVRDSRMVDPATGLFADASRACNVVIVLDCCHAGAFRGGDLVDTVAGPGRYVLTACRGTQRLFFGVTGSGTFLSTATGPT